MEAVVVVAGVLVDGWLGAEDEMREVKYRLSGTSTSEARCEKCCRRRWTARASV